MLWAPLTWKLGIAGCKLMSMITEMVAYVSILTVCAFTFERFTAICYPLRPSLHSGLRRTQIIVCCIWMISLVPSGVWTYYLQVIPLRAILFIVRSQAKVDVFWTIFANFWDKSLTISLLQLNSIEFKGTGEDVDATEFCNIAHEAIDLRLGVFSIFTTVLLYVIPLVAFPIFYSK